MQFTQTEITNLLVSIITITLAFTLALKTEFFVVLITVGLGFLLHELGHKISAENFECTTQYQSWVPGLVIAIGMAIVTAGHFIFAAPGWVAIYKKGGLTTKENGIISLAGPLVNLFLALGFLWLAYYTPSNSLKNIALIGFSVNSFLGFFNLIPIGPLDGKKVAEWSIPIWLIAEGILAFMTFALV